ncbi:hypothetical protein Ac2012v2_004562 [Leucoagaricus gongylophorus]
MHRLVCHSRRRVLQLSAKCNNPQLREYATPSSNPYPYPTHKSPTPHQIFHLPHSATENDIKARYFDLVRIYHPDKVGGVVPLEIARERFQTITTAYDILRGEKSRTGNSGPSSGLENRSYQTTAAYRAARRRRQELYSSGVVDDRWKDRIFLGLAVATVAMFILQISTTRREVMADVMMNPRQTGDGINRKPSEDEERLSA